MIRKATGAGNFKFKAETTDVRFSDVAGINEEREQLSEVVNFLKEPEKYTCMGARIPKGILLVGAFRVRKIFSEAKKVASSIIFIDEIDAVAQNRYSGKSYSEQTLNQLLAEMDGFDSSNHVIVIAATNHKEILDPAILRPGRFDRHVYVPMPNIKARIEIKNKHFDSEVDLEELARKNCTCNCRY